MESSLIILILTYLLNIVTPLLKTGFGNKWDKFTNVTLTTDILSEFSNIGSHFECVSLCLTAEACVSAFYRPQHRRCQLHDVLFMSPLDGQGEAGTVYYSVSTGACPPGYIHSRPLNFCYQLHLDNMLYADILADCSSRGEHLVTIDSQDKQNHFVKQVTASTDSRADKYYIDGSDAATEGQWVYHNSRPRIYFAWAPDFPETSSINRDFLVAGYGFKFRWQDRTSKGSRRHVAGVLPRQKLVVFGFAFVLAITILVNVYLARTINAYVT